MALLNIYRLNNHTKDFQKRGTVDAMVVVAEDEVTARRLACRAVKGHHGHGEEPTPEYLDPAQTYCEQIGIALPGQPTGVVVVDYDKDYNHVEYNWVEQ